MAMLKIEAKKGTQSIIITREFNAPRDVVFKAFTQKNFYVKWLGPRRLTTQLTDFSPKTGGGYRYVQRDTKGRTYAFHGVYHEIAVPERIVSTWEFEGSAGNVSLDTFRFEKLPGLRTRLVSASVFPSVAVRDGLLNSGMEQGVKEGYERLDQLLQELTEE